MTPQAAFHFNSSHNDILTSPRNSALLQILPARLNAFQAAYLLGFQEHDIPILVAQGLLRPLGKPVQNAIKYFAAKEILRLREDESFLAKATIAVANRWSKQNARKKSAHDENEPTELAA